MICSNCDEEKATSCCSDCSKQENRDFLLCQNCVLLHQQIKQTKYHRFEPYQIVKDVEAIYCCNCDEMDKSLAKFYCFDCLHQQKELTSTSALGNNNTYFCTGCSLIHPRVKGFRHHNMLPIYEDLAKNQSKLFTFMNFSYLSKYLQKFMLPIVDGYLIIYDKVEDFLDFHNTILSTGVVIIVVVAYFYFIKMIFGRITTLAHIAVLVVFNRYVTNNRRPGKKQLPANYANPRAIIKLLSANHSKASASNADSFSGLRNPFDRSASRGSSWGDLASKDVGVDNMGAAKRTGSLRARTKLYKR